MADVLDSDDDFVETPHRATHKTGVNHFAMFKAKAQSSPISKSAKRPKAAFPAPKCVPTGGCSELAVPAPMLVGSQSSLAVDRFKSCSAALGCPDASTSQDVTIISDSEDGASDA